MFQSAQSAACVHKVFGDDGELWMAMVVVKHDVWSMMVDVPLLHPVCVKHFQASAKCMRDSSPFKVLQALTIQKKKPLRTPPSTRQEVMNVVNLQ